MLTRKEVETLKIVSLFVWNDLPEPLRDEFYRIVLLLEAKLDL